MRVTTDQNLGTFKKFAGRLVSRHLETILAIPGGKLSESQLIETSTKPPHFFARYRKLRLDDGADEGQLKWLNLSATAATNERLQKLLNDTPI